jgi:hypothetical protein
MKTLKFVMMAVVSAAVLGVGACSSTEEAEVDLAEIGAIELEMRQLCGGIAAIRCPAGYACVDDPSDACDPDQGGADCGGICVKEKDEDKKRCSDPSKQYVSRDPAQCALLHFICAEGSSPFFDDCGCGCQTGERRGTAV